MLSLKFVSLFALALLIGDAAALVRVGTLPNLQHRIGGTLYIQDAKTLFIENFRYDGGGPDVFWYYFSEGDEVDRRGEGGTTIPFSDTRRNLPFGRRYNREDVTINLEPDQTVCDIAVFTMWCRRFQVFFTNIRVPSNLFEPRNSPGDPCVVRGLAPPTTPPLPTPVLPVTYENCQPLDTNLHLSWTVDRDAEVVHYELCGCTSSQEDTNQYMGFGLSASPSRTLMFGADVTITWVDDVNGANAQDYHLSNYVQCRAGIGACPDVLDSSGECTNDVFDVSGSKINGVQCVSYSKRFSAGDECDLPFDPDNENQYVVWGVGPLGETAFKHFNRATASDPPLFLGRSPPRDECSAPLQCQSCEPFQSQQIVAKEDATFVARIGPAGVDRGYVAITGQAGWGIAWYINGTLIPELVVQRGSTYTFVVEGGNDAGNLARFHPFYITDSQNGGILLNSVPQSETVYAGFDDDDNAIGIGHFCEYTETDAAIAALVGCGSVQDYQTYLQLECQVGEPAIFTWTPDENTPDLLFYQCANHLNLGWAIIVMDVPDPCAEMECPIGFECEVFAPTNEAFCRPFCDLDNGGCASNELCSLETVICKKAPCPPIVQCTNPCDTTECPTGYQCKTFGSPVIAFCDPSCDLDNGGCASNEVCSLQEVTCVTAPCPPTVQCTNPCDTIRCRAGHQCEVFEPTGEGFCNPSCDLDNGGCSSGKMCQLQEVQCVRAPCPPVVECIAECPPVCSYEFCSTKGSRTALCTNPNPAQSNCTGDCPLTFCHACYNLDSPVDTAPGGCALCTDYTSTGGRCFRRWATCIRRAHRAQYGTIRKRDRSESNFQCYGPC